MADAILSAPDPCLVSVSKFIGFQSFLAFSAVNVRTYIRTSRLEEVWKFYGFRRNVATFAISLAESTRLSLTPWKFSETFLGDCDVFVVENNKDAEQCKRTNEEQPKHSNNHHSNNKSAEVLQKVKIMDEKPAADTSTEHLFGSKFCPLDFGRRAFSDIEGENQRWKGVAKVLQTFQLLPNTVTAEKHGYTVNKFSTATRRTNTLNVAPQPFLSKNGFRRYREILHNASFTWALRHSRAFESLGCRGDISEDTPWQQAPEAVCLLDGTAYLADFDPQRRWCAPLHLSALPTQIGFYPKPLIQGAVARFPDHGGKLEDIRGTSGKAAITAFGWALMGVSSKTAWESPESFLTKPQRNENSIVDALFVPPEQRSQNRHMLNVVSYSPCEMRLGHGYLGVCIIYSMRRGHRWKAEGSVAFPLANKTEKIITVNAVHLVPDNSNRPSVAAYDDFFECCGGLMMVVVATNSGRVMVTKGRSPPSAASKREAAWFALSEMLNKSCQTDPSSLEDLAFANPSVKQTPVFSSEEELFCWLKSTADIEPVLDASITATAEELVQSYGFVGLTDLYATTLTNGVVVESLDLDVNKSSSLEIHTYVKSLSFLNFPEQPPVLLVAHSGGFLIFQKRLTWHIMAAVEGPLVDVEFDPRGALLSFTSSLDNRFFTLSLIRILSALPQTPLCHIWRAFNSKHFSLFHRVVIEAPFDGDDVVMSRTRPYNIAASDTELQAVPEVKDRVHKRFEREPQEDQQVPKHASKQVPFSAVLAEVADATKRYRNDIVKYVPDMVLSTEWASTLLSSCPTKIIALGGSRWCIIVGSHGRIVEVLRKGPELKHKLLNVLTGHKCPIYMTGYDGVRRFVTIDSSERLVLWDLHKCRPLVMMSLYDPSRAFPHCEDSYVVDDIRGQCLYDPRHDPDATTEDNTVRSNSIGPCTTSPSRYTPPDSPNGELSGNDSRSLDITSGEDFPTLVPTAQIIEEASSVPNPKAAASVAWTALFSGTPSAIAEGNKKIKQLPQGRSVPPRRKSAGESDDSLQAALIASLQEEDIRRVPSDLEETLLQIALAESVTSAREESQRPQRGPASDDVTETKVDVDDSGPTGGNNQLTDDSAKAAQVCSNEGSSSKCSNTLVKEAELVATSAGSPSQTTDDNLLAAYTAMIDSPSLNNAFMRQVEALRSLEFGARYRECQVKAAANAPTLHYRNLRGVYSFDDVVGILRRRRAIKRSGHANSASQEYEEEKEVVQSNPQSRRIAHVHCDVEGRVAVLYKQERVWQCWILEPLFAADTNAYDKRRPKNLDRAPSPTDARCWGALEGHLQQVALASSTTEHRQAKRLSVTQRKLDDWRQPYEKKVHKKLNTS